MKKNPKLQARRDVMYNVGIKIPVRLKREGDNWICYNRRYNISGYGRTLKMARKMFKGCVDEILKFIMPKKYSTSQHKKVEKKK